MICRTPCEGLADWKKGQFKFGCGTGVRDKLPPTYKTLLFYMRICVLNVFVLTRFVDSYGHIFIICFVAKKYKYFKF
jgi:hypothetical protein